jgi:hypothetical protein
VLADQLSCSTFYLLELLVLDHLLVHHFHSSLDLLVTHRVGKVLPHSFTGDLVIGDVVCIGVESKYYAVIA